MRATKDVPVHGAGADRSPGSPDGPLAGMTPADVSARPSLGTLLQHPLLAAAARREPRLYLLFARAQQHAGRPYAERVKMAVCLQQQAHALTSWVVEPSRQGAAQLALVCRTIDMLLLLGDLATDDGAAPVGTTVSASGVQCPGTRDDGPDAGAHIR